MNMIKYLLLSVILISCQSSSDSTKDSDAKDIDTVKELLTYEGKANMPHIVFISGDEEYRSEEALPQFAKIMTERHGFKSTVLFAQDPSEPGKIDPNYGNNIPGLENLASADLMVMFTRFRALPDDQMKHIDNYLKSGKPVVGMRTSTHAFKFKDIEMESNYQHYGNYSNAEDGWKDGFGRLVLGEHWINHHGKHGDQSTRGLIAEGAEGHSILNGIQDGDVWGPTDVYGVRLPLPGDSKPIIMGQSVDRTAARDDNDVRLGMRPTDDKLPAKIERKDRDGNPIMVDQNDPIMPVAWTKTYQIPGGQSGKCFSSTMGAATDLLEEGTRRLFVNSVFWSLDLEVPAKANVDLVGEYRPSKFAFHKDEHWDEKNMVIGVNVK